MGSAPSRSGSTTTKTSVQKICIDQSNGEVQSRENTAVARRASLALASTFTDRIRKSASSITSKRGLEKEKRVQSLQNQLSSSEKRRAEAEMFVKVLQKELATLDLRNKELMEEMDWLKQQLGTGSAMLNSIGPTKQPLSPCEELRRLKTKMKSDKNLYENLINKLQQELQEQEDQWKQRLHLEQSCERQMGKIQLESAHLDNPKQLDSPIGVGDSQKMSDDVRPSTCEQEPESSGALSLASSFSSVDLQPLCRNLLPRGGRMATPQKNSDKPAQHSFRQRSNTVSKQPSEHKFNIDQLMGEDDDKPSALQGNFSFSHDSGIFTVAQKGQVGETDQPRTKAKSAACRRMLPTMGLSSTSKQISNVFTLSGKLEPLKMVNSSPRAFTASSLRPEARKSSEGNVENLQLNGEIALNKRVVQMKSYRKVSAPIPTTTPKCDSQQLPDDSDFAVDYLDETDEEVNDILFNSLPSHSLARKIKSAKKMSNNEEKDSRRVSTSAKSHDSGYLEGQTTLYK